MAELQQVCEELIDNAEGSIGCAVIDFDAAMALATAHGSDAVLEADGMDLVTGAVSEILDGKLIRQFQRAWSDARAAGEFVREVQIATANSHCFIAAVPDWDNCALVLVTDNTVSLGLGWMSVHQALSQVADATRPAIPPARSTTTDTAPAGRPAAAAKAPPHPPNPAPAPEPSAARAPTRTGARPRIVTAPAARSAARAPSPQRDAPGAAKPEPPTAQPEPATPQPEAPTQSAETGAQPAPPETVLERGRARTYRGVPMGRRGAAEGDDAPKQRRSARYRGFTDGGGRSRPPRSDT